MNKSPVALLNLIGLAVLTDIGGDPDDQQSLVRLMVYASEFEIKALVASASGTPGELKQAVTRPDCPGPASLCPAIGWRGRQIDPPKRVMQTRWTGTGKSALAGHFRKRTAPRWWIDPHTRPQHETRLDGVKTSRADQAVRHVYRGFDFGPDIDWLDNPTYAPDREFDKEWSMGFLRMPWWNDLGVAYWMTGDEEYAREFVRQFHDFVAKHPILVKRTSGSKHPLKYAVPEWRTLEIGNRLSSSWTNAFFRFLSSPSMDDETICEMLQSFWEMGHHLEHHSSIREISSNWLIYETQGLHTVATLFPESADAGRWLILAEKRLTEELAKQVYPDGVQWELAPGYGAGVLRSFRRVHQLGVLNGRPMPPEYVATLERMYDYFATVQWGPGPASLYASIGW